VNEIILGIDYGEKRTGLAFGRSGLSSPLKVIKSAKSEVVISEIARSVVENKVTKIVVGIPLDVDGKDTPQSIKVRKFIKLMRLRIKVPIDFVSEYNTSSESVQSAIDFGVSKKGRKITDHISAALIVKRYFETSPRT